MRCLRRLSGVLTAATMFVPVTAVPGHAHHGDVQIRTTTLACPVDRVSSSAANGYGDTADQFFEREINCLRDYGIAYGRSPGSYAPDDSVSRRQMALFLSRLVAGAELSPSTPPPGFTDIGHVDDVTRSAIETVAGLGIASGKGDGRFAPDEPVTRGQMATFLNNTHGALAGRVFQPVGSNFDDPLGIHVFSIQALAHVGIAAGVAPREFAVERPVSRAQMAGFLGRLLDIEVDERRLRWAYATPDEPGPAVYTSTGLRCTIVGSNDDDVLTGTPAADVMCGRGGDDRMDGAESDDVLDGGDGRDRMDGGVGSDELLGGGGDDTLVGDDGNDTLYGEDHDDLLDGGQGADLVDGGAGTNRCPPSADDERISCWWDEAPPTALSADVFPTAVDVTEADAELTLRMHLQDDTGVMRVQVIAAALDVDRNVVRQGPFFMEASLVSGTPTDGVWESRGVARRYLEPGSYGLEVSMTDVVGRDSYAEFSHRVEVSDAQPDRAPPVVVSASAWPETGEFPLDVRSGPASVVVEARITDDLSGVAQRDGMDGHSLPLVCLDYPKADGEYGQVGGCLEMEMVSGDVHDGVHRAMVAVPQGSVGDLNLRLLVADRAGSAAPHGTVWLGPDLYQRHLDGPWDEPNWHALPDGVGRIPVRSGDAGSPSWISDAIVTPAEVDSRHQEHLVRVAVHAGDPDGDLLSVHGFLYGDGAASSSSFARVGTSQVSGTRADGWWHVDFLIPQGTPPATYYLQFAVKDAAGNTTRYVSRNSGAEGGAPVLPGPGTVTVTS